MKHSSPPILRCAARLAGWVTFVLFELAVVALARIAGSIQCCAASGVAGPQSASEWAALALFAATMLLLGAAVGGGGAFIAEGVLRVAERVRRCGESGS